MKGSSQCVCSIAHKTALPRMIEKYSFNLVHGLLHMLGAFCNHRLNRSSKIVRFGVTWPLQLQFHISALQKMIFKFHGSSQKRKMFVLRQLKPFTCLKPMGPLTTVAVLTYYKVYIIYWQWSKQNKSKDYNFQYTKNLQRQISLQPYFLLCSTYVFVTYAYDVTHWHSMIKKADHRWFSFLVSLTQHITPLRHFVVILYRYNDTCKKSDLCFPKIELQRK